MSYVTKIVNNTLKTEKYVTKMVLKGLKVTKMVLKALKVTKMVTNTLRFFIFLSA